MSATELLAELAGQGVSLWVEGERLRARAPEGILTDEVRRRLAEHKEAILVLLNRDGGGGAGPMPDRARRGEPFPLTDIQQAYLAGRDAAYAMGRVACHAYFELEGPGLDPTRLAAAWNQLVERHGMLRAVLLPDGTQRILEQVPPYVIAEVDLRGLSPDETAAGLAAVRGELAAQVLPVDRWPLFDLRVSRFSPAGGGPGERTRVHVSLDMLALDAASIFSAFAEWSQLYRDPDAVSPPPEVSFRDCVLAELAGRDTEEAGRAERYWLDRLADLPPPPEPPFARSPAEIERPRFRRRSAGLDAAGWTRCKSLAAQAGLTPSAVVCAAYAEVLAAWSKSRRFTLTVPLFLRPAGRPELESVLGDFTSTVLLAVEDEPGGFAHRARRLHARLADDLEHARFSGVRVLREQQRRGDLAEAAPAAVFTSLLGHRAFRGGGEPPTAWLGELVWGITQTPQVWLDLHLFEEAGALRFNWDVVEELLPDGVVDAMWAAFRGLLERLADGAEAWEERPALTPAAHLALYAEANATAGPVPAGRLHEPFRRRAAEQPDAPAVRSAGGILSYGDLQRQADALTSRLRALGAGPNRLVAVVMEKGWEQVVAVLGILGAGAAYLPVSPDQPAERLRWMLEHGEVELAVTQAALEASLDWPPGVRRLGLERGPAEPDPPPAGAEGAQEGAAEDLAYVIYTSGSTGRPKGVAIDHRAALNTVLDVNRRFGVGPDDRVLALSSLSFDLSVWDVFGLLAAGGTVVIPEPWAGRDPARWLEWLRSAGVTVWNTVPTLLEMLVEHAAGRGETLPSSLRLVLLSGDWIPLTLPERLRSLAPGARLISLGGATEASIWSILHPVERVEAGWRSVPYGRAMTNQTFQALDADLEPRPVWVEGPLYIGGIGLARGYWRDPERTRAAFVTHPRGGERLYRTGDVGRWLPDGTLELLGREDFQVKVQGHRIELGEVEAALLRHPEVRAGVVAVAGDPRGARRLVAYVVGGAPGLPDRQDLLDFLAGHLPAPLLPADVVHLEALPLTANGKVDRRALPDPGAGAVHAGFTPPRNPLERQLAAIWADLLGVEAVGVHDDFLRLGGNSLLAIRLYTRLNAQLGIDLPLRALLHAGTIERLAKTVQEALAAAGLSPTAEAPLPSLVPAPESSGEPFPLTDIQQAYWLGRTGAFELGNVAPHGYLELESGDLDLPRFQAAWRHLIARHGMLRAVVLPDGRQQVLAEVPDYTIEVLDLRGLPAPEGEGALAALRERMSHQVLAADRWPLFEIRATLLDGGRVRLHLSLDLLIGDAWSMVRLVQELAELYEHPASAEGGGLPPLALSFRDYVLACESLQGSPQHRRSLEYWRRRLPALPPAPELPLARDPSSLLQPRFVRRSAGLPREPWARLQARAAAAGLTPSSLLMGAFAEVLAAWSKSPRFTLNTTLFNRLPLHPEVDQLVGDFTSMILLAVDLSSPGPFEARARRLQEQLWEDLDHRFVSGVQVLRELARAQGGSRHAAMPVVFTSTLVEGGTGDRSGIEWFRLGEPVFSISQTPQVWLDHQVFEERGALLFTWDAVEDLFPAGLLDAMFAAYGSLLARLAAGEAAWGEPARLTPAADLALYAEVNAAAAAVMPLPRGLLHEPFLRQAAAHPERTAVVAADRRLSYGELQLSSRALARRLRALGARPNRLVAVVMEKGWEQVVAVLAVLQSGAAYLPVSPDLPAERLRWTLEHGEVELVLTQPRLDAALDWPAGIRRLTVTREEDDADEADAALEASSPAPQDAGDIAYVIYTSGSTGRPKGVVIDHRGALNTCADVDARFQIGPQDRVLALSSLAFDLSVWDVFGILGAGGTVVLPEAWAGREPARWLDWLRDEGITVWNTVPALLEMLIEHATARGEALPGSLRLVMLSGDWIPLTLPERLRALAPAARMVSLGGATEASIWSILYPIESVDPQWRSVPYGRPMANQTFQALGEDLEPRPLWVPGQLCIGGAGLALGYWRDEEKTRASFVTHPRTGERLYRTGDLGRWLPDGNLEFLGREDFQVKVQGHRIELGEIEATLAQHPAVRAAVAAAVGDPRGVRRLVAWVVPAEGEEATPAATAAAPDPFHDEGSLRDPLARLEFKLSRPGIRRDAREASFPLARPADGAQQALAYRARRSQREFLRDPLAAERLGALLSCLALRERDGLAHYRYASAGALYPVQTYVWVHPGRVAALPGGAYYYHPGEHALVPLALDAELPAAIHAPVNRPIFAGAAFSLFLVGQLQAIAPLYGEGSRDFCLLEAGYMSQLLMSEAAGHGIGLCPIGGYDTGPVWETLGLGESQVPLHSLLGGAVDPARAAAEPAAGTVRQRQARDPLREPELRDFLAARLPAQMIPSAFVFLPALPLSANGKVDRQRLAAPAADEERPGAVAPRTGLERTLAGLLQEVLEIDRVGITDNFFHLGASSLHIVQLNNKLRATLGHDLPIVEMFRFSSIAALAAHLGTLGTAPGAAADRVGQAAGRAEARREEMTRRRGSRGDRRGGPR